MYLTLGTVYPRFRLLWPYKANHSVSYGEGKLMAAMQMYRDALVQMYPWNATALLFTSTDAFKYGIAQL